MKNITCSRSVIPFTSKHHEHRGCRSNFAKRAQKTRPHFYPRLFFEKKSGDYVIPPVRPWITHCISSQAIRYINFILWWGIDIGYGMNMTLLDFWSDPSKWNNSKFSDFTQKCIFSLENRDNDLNFFVWQGAVVMQNILNDFCRQTNIFGWKSEFCVGGGG